MVTSPLSILVVMKILNSDGGIVVSVHCTSNSMLSVCKLPICNGRIVAMTSVGGTVGVVGGSVGVAVVVLTMTVVILVASGSGNCIGELKNTLTASHQITRWPMSWTVDPSGIVSTSCSLENEWLLPIPNRPSLPPPTLAGIGIITPLPQFYHCK